jgi:hypothetical protein
MQLSSDSNHPLTPQVVSWPQHTFVIGGDEVSGANARCPRDNHVELKRHNHSPPRDLQPQFCGSSETEPLLAPRDGLEPPANRDNCDWI